MKIEYINEAIRRVLDPKEEWLKIPDKEMSRIIGTLIYEINAKHTGLTSTSLCNEDGFRILPPVKEHFHSRQQAGYSINDKFKKLGSDYFPKKMLKDLDKYSRVHYVTKEENIRLIPFQNGPSKNLPWQKQYELAGITLVKDIGTVPRNYYSTYVTPDGTFKNFGELSKYYENEDIKEIKKRIASPAIKWIDWQKID